MDALIAFDMFHLCRLSRSVLHDQTARVAGRYMDIPPCVIVSVVIARIRMVIAALVAKRIACVGSAATLRALDMSFDTRTNRQPRCKTSGRLSMRTPPWKCEE